jgi:predicted nucleotidyltransferase component of viral defense system
LAAKTPWPESRQVEQDLIFCRALVAVFSDEFLRGRLAFRGGTALNKLFFDKPYRYSEDLDFVQVIPEGIGATLDALRKALAWLGDANYRPATHSPKLIYRFPATDGEAPLRVKIEINTREHEAYFKYVDRPFEVRSGWFVGSAVVKTYVLEEIMATKLRALLQRDKGRDLFDLGRAIETFENMDHAAVADGMHHYLRRKGGMIIRAKAEQRIFAKLRTMTMLSDMRPLVPYEFRDTITEEAAKTAAADVLCCLLSRFPGESWASTPDRIAETGLQPFLDRAAEKFKCSASFGRTV